MSVALYRRLVRLYPRPFRAEYGDDMVLLFAEQLRDEGAARVWGRSLVDLAITVPTQRLQHRTGAAVSYTYLGVSAVAAIAASASPSLATFAIGMAIAIGSLVLGVTSWLRTRTVGAGPTTAHWWRILLAGIGVLAATSVIVQIVGELPEGWWLPTMFTLLVGLITTAAGVVLGLARLTHR